MRRRKERRPLYNTAISLSPVDQGPRADQVSAPKQSDKGREGRNHVPKAKSQPNQKTHQATQESARFSGSGTTNNSDNRVIK